MIKYGNVWNENTIKALLNLKSLKMTYDQKVSYRKFCDEFDKERKIIYETAIEPNAEKLKVKDPEVEKEVLVFLNKDCDLKKLPSDFFDLVEKSDLCLNDEECLKPLIAEKVHLAVVV